MRLSGYLEAALQRWPSAPAVRAGGTEWSFAELGRESGRVATWLRGVGVGPGDRVGIFLERSPEAFAALFGVMAVGGVTVPLDGVAPPTRNGVILRDAGVQVLVSAGRWGRRLGPLLERAEVSALLVLGPRPRRWPSLSVPTSWGSGLPEGSLARQGGAETDLATLLYTSGSTGRPKGVALSHGAVGAFVDWAVETFGIGPGDRLSGVSPLHFDLSTLEVYGSVAAGATAVIAPTGASAFPATLARLWEEERITVWYSVPSVLSRLLEAKLSDRDLSAMRAVLFAGEVFGHRRLARLMELLPSARFANLFGPTETNVCTWFEVPGPPSEEIPIGTAASGATLHLEGEELWVAGPSVMAGYHGDPEATAAAFAEREGVRYLRTGDRVALGEDGQLRFVGRLDTMLKVQGHRVQPEEVEGVLGDHPEVSEVVVVPIRNEEGAIRLEARVVGGGSEEELLRWCWERLPGYMVPSRIRWVEALERSARGKLVRG